LGFRRITRAILRTVSAGDILLILKVDLWDGWSLAKTTKQSRDPGLIPREYYVLTADFLPSATVSAFSRSADERAAALAETHKPSIEPLQMQPTGYGYSFPNIKERLLGGMSLNRFSSFVTTGAEDFVLNGAEAEEVTNPKELEEELDPDGDEEYPTERKKTDHHFVGVSFPPCS
jgi:sorting nexin-9/18/33